MAATQRLALWLYSALMWAVQPLLRRKLRRRALAEPGYGVAVEERFGRYAPALDSVLLPSTGMGAAPLVWVHAVSLGETRAAAILVRALRRQIPGMRLLLTHGTATGRAEGAQLLQPGDVQVWLPWDTPGAVQRFLRRLRPAIGILMETEIWPNLVAGCRRHGVPLVLANARLNPASLRKALRLPWLARPAYGGLTAAWAQTEADAGRLRALGAPVRAVLGNLKFDARPDADLLAQGRAWRAATPRPVVLLASTRAGEEALWLQEYQRNLAKTPAGQAPAATDSGAAGVRGVQWLIVPRHPQRFDEVARLLRDAGLSVSRRSTWAQPVPDCDVWLGDTLGEMPLYYGLADVALLGGSFAPLGGQNLIEAAACGCPLLLGPHTFNFADAADKACAAGAAWRVDGMAQGVQAALALVRDTAQQQAACEAAAAFASAHRGAARATAVAVHRLLARAPARSLE
ncbi:MAG: 3-deoxy-D-manno-octulosonic acid transferase [Burkholderiales bacterium]|nr:3-deoxy-D-manno-octulosonic acid transferase [Burkholderiales bacterium]